MGDEKDAFYIVRKGDIIGVYRSLIECQQQAAGSSDSDPPVSVYKGYGLPNGVEDFISSFGIKNALFSINASYIKDDDVFGKLIPCPLQQPSSSQGGTFDKPSLPKRLQEMEGDASSLLPPQKQLKIADGMVPRVIPSTHLTRLPILKNIIPPNKMFQLLLHLFNIGNLTPLEPQDSCTIEFDGASKGNPGKAGAGAVLRASYDNSVLFYLREGVGIATNNVAEYRALILGLKFALEKGFRNVRVQGDSMLVCMQVQDAWKTKHPKMIELCKQAKELKRQFKSFHIQHVDRELNSDADAQANHAISLSDGQTKEIAGS